MGDDGFRELHAALARHGQEALLRFWDGLDAAGRERLGRDVRSLDLDLIDRLVETLVRAGEEPAEADAIDPVEPDPAPSADAIAEGEDALARGAVAVVIVAGGQGTRLGFDGPKGCYPIGPVTDRSLFQIHCAKVAAPGRPYGTTPPLYVMTSEDNHAATESFLARHDRFGLDHLRLFRQGPMPA